MQEAVIVDAVRTPTGRRNGQLSEWHPADLAGHVLNALVERNNLDPALVDDVVGTYRNSESLELTLQIVVNPATAVLVVGGRNLVLQRLAEGVFQTSDGAYVLGFGRTGALVVRKIARAVRGEGLLGVQHRPLERVLPEKGLFIDRIHVNDGYARLVRSGEKAVDAAQYPVAFRLRHGKGGDCLVQVPPLAVDGHHGAAGGD